MAPDTGKNESHATDEVFVAPDPIPSFPVRAPFDAEAQAAARSRIDDIFAEVEEELRLEAERVERERAEAELRARLERDRLEAERIAREEAERLEAERLERERLEAERLEAERLEAERLEAERIAREEAERLEREAAEAARREELERQLAAVAAASHMAHFDEEAFARLEDRPRRGAHFAVPADEVVVEEEAQEQTQEQDREQAWESARVPAQDAVLDIDAVFDADDLDALESDLEPESAYDFEDDYEDETPVEAEALNDVPATGDATVAPVDEPHGPFESYGAYGAYEEYESYDSHEPSGDHESAEPINEAPVPESFGGEYGGMLADIFDYDDLDEVEDLDERVVVGGRGVEVYHFDHDDHDGRDDRNGEGEGDLGDSEDAGEERASSGPSSSPEPVEADTGETSSEEGGVEDAHPFEDEEDGLMRDVSDSAFQDFDDIDEPEVVVIYNEAQIEEAGDDAPPAGADPGLEATLVLDRVADAVKKLRVEGESAPITQVREQSSEAEIHTEFQVSEDDKERLEVVRRDVTSVKGQQSAGFFARIGAFVVKALHLDER